MSKIKAGRSSRPVGGGGGGGGPCARAPPADLFKRAAAARFGVIFEVNSSLRNVRACQHGATTVSVHYVMDRNQSGQKLNGFAGMYCDVSFKGKRTLKALLHAALKSVVR